MAISQYPTRSQESHRRKRSCLPEIAPQGHFLALRAQGATAPLGPRNDNSKPLHVRRCRSTTCDCQRRLLSAATDAIGFHVLSPALYELQVPSRDCHVGLRPPRNDNSEVHTVLTVVRSYRQRCAGRGQPGPYSVRLAASRVTIHCPFSMIRFPAHHIICQGSRQSTGCSPFSCKKALICENGRLPKKPR